MYRAKEDGRGRFHIFDEGLHERATRRLAVGNELRQALDNSELRLEYQPLVRIDNSAIIGFEALIRWDNPGRGRMRPVDFIPLAEETRLIVPIGDRVLREACRQAATWIQGSYDVPATLRISVNVSAVQLSQLDFVDSVATTLRESQLPSTNLCVEITESVLMADPEAYLETLIGLKRLGVSIAIHDFGTGYSSLGYLNRFPIDVIKIDKSFVDTLGSGDERSRSILRAVVDLSRVFCNLCVAEGVETVDQAIHLVRIGCEAAQGYHFGRPQDPSKVSTRLALPFHATDR